MLFGKSNPVVMRSSDIGAIEVGTLNLLSDSVHPVHLSAPHIQREAPWIAPILW